MLFNLRSIGVVLLFVVCVSSGLAQNTKPDQSTKTAPVVQPTPEKIGSLKVNFPEVEGWELSDPYFYPTPDAGHSVNYDSPGNGRVTVYVYTGGHKKISDELSGPVKDELEMAKAAIKSAGEQGIYKDVKELKTEKIVLGGSAGKVNVLRSKFTLSRDGNKLASEIYVFPYRNNIIKLRVTRPVSAGAEGDASFAKLLSEMDAVFSK